MKKSGLPKRLRTAVIGVGYLGKFHAQKYAILPEAQLIAVCDTNAEHAGALAHTLGVQALLDYQALAGQVDAVSIATPTPTHHAVARFFLAQGVHVLLEKPISVTLEQADDLIKTAQKNNAILQIGHIERFNNVFQALEPMLANLRFIESQRLAPFKLRGTDVSVVLDMMIHDIDLIQALVKSPIRKISAIGAPVLSPLFDIANARLEFENSCVANITASRVHARISRRLHLFQQDAFFNCDLQHKKITIQRKRFDEVFPGIPEMSREKRCFPKDDPLKAEISAFLTAILENKPPMVSGEEGKKALETALKITDMIAHHG